ncbi:hypothetical protein OIU85_004168 [Salix viminalis]|uniref:Uncharacterized protein n=1 Tax=Salix viminalis TaxID=40686 RepID=A0A9Q0PS64_SALVM|nr:hypothetical protein OIU85_004168 [Salix viminalis]
MEVKNACLSAVVLGQPGEAQYRQTKITGKLFWSVEITSRGAEIERRRGKKDAENRSYIVVIDQNLEILLMFKDEATFFEAEPQPFTSLSRQLSLAKDGRMGKLPLLLSPVKDDYLDVLATAAAQDEQGASIELTTAQ